ncbi:MAG: LysM peptidoglycan-binding domain-containing protein [Methyloceanibacter sp.]|jgi:nucleoid-associated protein YgaU|nr:LysM peptidoglycan-binding domain-containing protein [Methyloceanibacter sp.]
MRGRKFISWAILGVALICVAVALVYFYLPSFTSPSATEQAPVAGETSGPAAEPPGQQAEVPAEPPSKPQAEATDTVQPPSKPMTVPSFDVVLVEPNGEGVLAGRAEPGWTVSVESDGTKMAEATADEQGEWSVVLEKPLPPGDYVLSLQTISPDGTRALSSQQTVSVAVAKAEKKEPASVPETVAAVPHAEAAKPAPAEADQKVAAQVESKPEAPNETSPEAAPREQPQAGAAAGEQANAAPSSAPPSAPQPSPQVQTADDASSAPTPAAAPKPEPTTQAVSPQIAEAEAGAKPAGAQGASGGEPSPSPQAPAEKSNAPSPSPSKATIAINTVGYQDTDADTGKMRLAGTSDPGAAIQLYFDDKPFANVIADSAGRWSAETDMKLGVGQHTLRAERYDETARTPAGQATVTFERRAPQVVAKAPAAAAVPSAAASQPAPAPSEAKPSATAPSPAASPQVAAIETGNAEPAPKRIVHHKKGRPSVYTIRRGDTLWGIARRYLGGGSRYTSIYHGNRRVIRDPDEILPQQKVKLPKR